MLKLAAVERNTLAPWGWRHSADGLTTSSEYTANSFVASTTGWSANLFTNSAPLIYLGLGVTVAIAVAVLLRRSLGRLIRGVTRGGRR